jgi:hypothetical protein
MQSLSESSSPRMFDVSKEADAFRASFLQTRKFYLMSATIALIMGPVLGLVALTQYNGPIVGLEIGLIIGLCLGVPMLLLAYRTGRHYPVSVAIGAGRLAYEDARHRTVSFDFHRLRSPITVVTFESDALDSGLPNIGLSKVMPWIPYFQSKRGYLLLSHSAAQALSDEILASGWKRQEKQYSIGDLHTTTWKFRR